MTENQILILILLVIFTLETFSELSLGILFIVVISAPFQGESQRLWQIKPV